MSKLRKLTEARESASCLSDIIDDLEISTDLMVSILDNYFSVVEVGDIEKYVKRELGIDDLTEDINTDKLISEISDNELRSIIKSNGVNLSGSENKDELTGMVKALVSTDEGISRRLKEATKLKRKKGIGKKYSKFLEERQNG